MGIKIAISIDGSEDFLVFKAGKDWKAFDFYQKSVVSYLANIKNMDDFRQRGRELMKAQLLDFRYEQELEYDYLIEKEIQDGFVSKEPKILKGTVAEIQSKLQKCRSTAEILFALKALLDEGYFNISKSEGKSFLTFFSQTLFGTHRKTVLYHAYTELLKKDYPNYFSEQ
jgi:hypothetical protein